MDKLTAADNMAPLEPEDLIRLGTAAELSGVGGNEILTRAHQAFLSRGDSAGAAVRLLDGAAPTQPGRAQPRRRMDGARPTARV